MPAYVFNGDATVVAVDASSFTAAIDDPNSIVVAPGSRAVSLTVIVIMDDGVSVPVALGDVLRVSTRVA